MSDIPNQKPIPQLTVYINPDAFKRLLHDVCSDLASLWADAGTPEIVDGSAAHTLILRRDALPIQCAKVCVRRYFPITFWSTVRIDFVGDASTLPLYIALINALGNALPDGESPFYESAKDERETLRYYAALYTKSLKGDIKKSFRQQAIDKAISKELSRRKAFEWLQKQTVDERVKDGTLAPEKAEALIKGNTNDATAFESFSKSVRRAKSKANTGGQGRT